MINAKKDIKADDEKKSSRGANIIRDGLRRLPEGKETFRWMELATGVAAPRVF